MDDAQALFLWRNDPDTRRNSINTEPVAWEGHVAWLTKSLGMPTRKLYVAEVGGTPVGTVRADNENGIEELSWTVAPEARGKGFGKMMVLQFVQEKLRGEKIIARIKDGNPASAAIAKALGLSPGPAEDNTATWR